MRAGDNFLGPVWAAVNGPLTPDREQAFQDAAKLVALHLLCHRAGPDAQNRLRADLVSTMRPADGTAGLVPPGLDAKTRHRSPPPRRRYEAPISSTASAI
ncbi:hypothetical protein MUK60_42400 [Streptomyces sp. LRE541]|uniref:hypothetical protein n=1 Tax=Streptomyces sp. LRE541 TaxID=2931983 RepID=UPI0020103C6E|nr:hypothetical protein [Streptomyces sp. LRE541]UPZ33870.1 hypothetical protein MUK60_42400 [Streptomyces sp. LRE541]